MLTFLCLVSASFLKAGVEFSDGTRSWQQMVERYVKSLAPPVPTDSISGFLTDQGFLDNSVMIDGGPENNMKISFGARYQLGDVIFEEDYIDTVEYGAPFEKKSLEAVMDSVIGSFQAEGFYYASATPYSFRKREGEVDIYFTFLKGPLVTISAVELAGLKRTDPDFLRRHLTINYGDTLRPRELEASARAFRRFDFLDLTGPPAVTPEAGFESVRIRYDLAERRPFSVEGAGGYVPDDDGYFTWFLDLKGRNILGRGQKAGLLADRRERSKSVLSVYYGQPTFLLGRAETMLRIGTRDYRDRFYEFAAALSHETELNENISLRSQLGWKNVEPADTTARSFQVYEVGVGIRAGSVEAYKGAPVEFSLDWQISYSGRRYRQKENAAQITRAVYNDTRNELKARLGIPISALISGYTSIEVKDTQSSEKPLPFSEMYFIGGAGSLRGYRNDQFSGHRVVISKSELRFFVSYMDYLYPFVDGAYFEHYDLGIDGEISKLEDFKWGYGFGLRLSSDQRQLGMEFSWGEGANLDEPRLHITLGSRF
jgi:outer membrane protein assembly factor BamA